MKGFSCDEFSGGTGAKYIKLGEGGRWEDLCLEEGTLRFQYAEVPHESALAGDRAKIREIYFQEGLPSKKASDHARQVLDFYHAGQDTLWITFANGYLWWCFAEEEVTYLGPDSKEGIRLRKTVDGWRNHSLKGVPLRVSELNGNLTKVASYRMTICNVTPLKYLIAKINDEEVPEVAAARRARESLLDSTQDLLKLLPWRDFELLVDLVFSQSGWRRIGESGGTQKTVDIELVLPSTGERAFVQVKSRTDQAQLNDYIGRLSHRDESRMFYVYHSSEAALSCEDPRVALIGPDRLSEMILNAGLFDWLLKKTG